MMPANAPREAPAPIPFVTDAWFARALAQQLAPLPLDTRQCIRAIAEWIVTIAPAIAGARADLDDFALTRRLLKIGEDTIEHVLAMRMDVCGRA